MIELEQYQTDVANVRQQILTAGEALQVGHMREQIDELSEEMNQPEFWNDLERSTKVNQKLGHLKNRLNHYEKLLSTADDIEVMISLAKEENDESMVQEVRRQFREIRGILTGEGTPDYARCVEISTRGAQREMMFPSLLAIVVPVAVGLVFGVAGVMGLLVGGLSSGFVLAVFMANAGGAWDNAKKMVEEGHFGGKGSECHKATVVGDTVGDPFKDTSGPSLNILIKLMSMVSIVMAGLTVACHLF